MELIKDYELVIEYHPGKAKMVADAFSRKSSAFLAYIRTAYVPILMEMRTLGLDLSYDGCGALLASFVIRPSLVDQIRGRQMQDEKLIIEIQKIINGEASEGFSIAQDGMLTLRCRICVPDVDDLRKLIMEEAHCSAYMIQEAPKCIAQLRRTTGGQV